MTQEEQRTIGKLQQAVETLSIQAETNRVEARENFRQLFDMLRDLQTKGCAVGERNLRAIERMEKRPEKALAAGAMVIACIVAVAELFRFWRP